MAQSAILPSPERIVMANQPASQSGNPLSSRISSSLSASSSWSLPTPPSTTTPTPNAPFRPVCLCKHTARQSRPSLIRTSGTYVSRFMERGVDQPRRVSKYLSSRSRRFRTASTTPSRLRTQEPDAVTSFGARRWAPAPARLASGPRGLHGIVPFPGCLSLATTP